MHIKLLLKSAVTGAIFFLLYLLVVVYTTPNFPPLIAVNISLNLNGIYIFGGVIGIAVQTYILGYSKILPAYCKITNSKAVSSTNILGSITSAFFSFFALIGVGCCGTWLFVLSLLPGVFGVGATSFLIQYSTQIAQFGLVLMALSNIYAYHNLRQKIKTFSKM
jgi:hypothetical protein